MIQINHQRHHQIADIGYSYEHDCFDSAMSDTIHQGVFFRQGLLHINPHGKVTPGFLKKSCGKSAIQAIQPDISCNHISGYTKNRSMHHGFQHQHEKRKGCCTDHGRIELGMKLLHNQKTQKNRSSDSNKHGKNNRQNSQG